MFRLGVEEDAKELRTGRVADGLDCKALDVALVVVVPVAVADAIVRTVWWAD